jgi:hypothetical protein
MASSVARSRVYGRRLPLVGLIDRLGLSPATAACLKADAMAGCIDPSAAKFLILPVILVVVMYSAGSMQIFLSEPYSTVHDVGQSHQVLQFN